MRFMHRRRQPYPSSLLRPDYRFIRTIQAPEQIVLDKASGLYRFSSAAFGPSRGDGSLSGDLEELLVRDGLNALTMFPAVDRAVGAASLHVQDIRGIGLGVHHEPVELNWYHGGVRGFRGNASKKLQKAAVELVPIDQEAAQRSIEERDRKALAAAQGADREQQL